MEIVNKELMKKIRNFIYDTYVFDEETIIKDDESLMDTGLIDSTGVLELTQWLESEFNITISDDDIRPSNLDSVEKIEAFVEKKQNG